jgi:hypothetical protein
MSWRAMGLADIARCHAAMRHGIGCHLTREWNVQMRVDDVAGTICLLLAEPDFGSRVPQVHSPVQPNERLPMGRALLI